MNEYEKPHTNKQGWEIKGALFAVNERAMQLSWCDRAPIESHRVFFA
jgi:hypothetical protein